MQQATLRIEGMSCAHCVDTFVDEKQVTLEAIKEAIDPKVRCRAITKI